LEVVMADRGQVRLIGAAAAVCAALAVALVPGVALAQNPPAPTVILGGHLYPKPFGDTYVYGRLEVPATMPAGAVAGQTVTLYASGFPFANWAQVATLTTDFGGYFSYHSSIGQNTSYRAIWQTSPPVQSKDKLVKLPLKLSLKASHSVVKRKGMVTFSGAGAPAHPGAKVELQQADKNGRFKTFAGSALSAANRFSKRVRLRRGGVFRVLFAGDGQFGISASRPVRVSVHK
jgi:hypothetical protein